MLFFFNHNNDYNNILKSDWLSNRTSCRPIGPAIILVVKVARYSFSRSIPPKFERKLRRHKQGFGKIDTTVVLDKEENWL